MVKYITDMTEYQGLKSGDKLLVVDFTASWCPPCKMIAPHFDQIASENPDIVCVKVDVDDAADIAGLEGISAMPTFKFFKGGNQVHMIQGANLPAIKAKVAELK